MAGERIDPVLVELARMLPPGVDVVALPAEEATSVPVPDGPAADAVRADTVARLHEAWTVLFGDAAGPPAADVRWVRTMAADGPSTYVSASAAQRATIAPAIVDTWVTKLGEAGWRAERRDRGAVPRLVARKRATAVEVQVRPSTGTVAVRAMSPFEP